MLFTWSTKNLCIVFRQWHIRGPVSLVVSLLAVMLLSAGYEAIREFTRRYEASCAGQPKDSLLGAPSSGMSGFP
jgi:copper transporter 1